MGVIVSEEELKDHAYNFLESKDLMTLATSHKDRVWAAVLFYEVTPDFEVIFYSRPGTRHTDNIEKNTRVSVTITEIPVHNNLIRGIQMTGEARKVDGVEWNKYYPIYEKKYAWAKNFSDHIIYVIKPEEIWMIDEKNFGHTNRTRVI